MLMLLGAFLPACSLEQRLGAVEELLVQPDQPRDLLLLVPQLLLELALQFFQPRDLQVVSGVLTQCVMRFKLVPRRRVRL